MGVQHFYHTANGKAVLNVEGKPLKKLGVFPNEALAKAACEKHFDKVLKAARNFGRPTPTAHFM
jgi:hypothetical protein